MVLASLGFLPFLGSDPAPGMWRGKERARNLDCQVASAEAGHREHPGEIAVSGPRGDFFERDAVLCRERLLPAGVRAPADEAVLWTLDRSAARLVAAAEGLHPELAGHTWLVEVFHPSAPVSAKVSFAVKNTLVARGLAVSDRTPALSASDVDVLTRMPPDLAYPSACRRYAATGAVREGDALLAVLVRDPRETVLHAGLCVGGAWWWLE